MWVQSLGQKDPLEKGMATHSSIHAWRIPRTEDPGRLQSTGSQRTGYDRRKLAYIKCQAVITFISRTFSSSQTETLYPLNNNDAFPSAPAPANLCSTFCVYWFAYFRKLR